LPNPADWSPDGRWIAFRTQAETDGVPSDLEVIHPDGSGRRNLTHYGTSGNTALSSSFSPDGRFVVFAAQHDGGPADLFIMRSNGTDLQPLTRSPGWESAPDLGARGRIAATPAGGALSRSAGRRQLIAGANTQSRSRLYDRSRMSRW
jgi:Tol biopolymer transport system component